MGVLGTFGWVFVCLLSEVQTKWEPVTRSLYSLLALGLGAVLCVHVCACVYFPKTVGLGKTMCFIPNLFIVMFIGNGVVRRRSLPVASTEVRPGHASHKIINILRSWLHFYKVWLGQEVPKQTGPHFGLWGQQGSLFLLTMMGQAFWGSSVLSSQFNLLLLPPSSLTRWTKKCLRSKAFFPFEAGSHILLKC